MVELLTSAQMRAAEQAAMASGAVTGLELMERAGRGVVKAALDAWPELAHSANKAVVLCGPGNNGGDGFVIARLLKQRGWEVEVFLYGTPEKLPPDARANYEKWHGLGEVAGFADLCVGQIESCDLVIDALFGTGLTRPIPAEMAVLAQGLAHLNGAARRVAVDLPTGLCSDSGRILGDNPSAVFPSDLTVSFHTLKLGHVLGQGPQICGQVAVADIGLNAVDDTSQDGAIVTLYDGPPRSALAKQSFGHKYSHGHALILTGPSGKTGAGRLAARAALRVGAGLVTLGTPHEAVTEVAAQITALMLTEIDTPDLLTRVLSDPRLNALCFGPGFGVARAGAFLPAVLASGRATVLDADALTALAQSDSGFVGLHENCVLTPHAGEFKRLFPDLAARLSEPPLTGPAYSKVDATRSAARRAGCTVLFKGPDTVIASPDGQCSVSAAVYERAAPWLATAGAGDVLAGLIAGLMARGFPPHQAAETAAWLHVESARCFGPGLIAEDLPETLPKVLRGLGL
ncbi:NAD(P)H-hydrate dehydratase [Celeribacter halophilus]|uniref:NAD(P)H-hydrate dehydratase n=1 Tax=Celeribacter halophilus TaxID=576117 RepID=UPI003A8D8D51